MRDGVMIAAEGFGKRFTLHERNLTLAVLSGVDLTVSRGECVALDGPSGSGKSSLMRAIYGNYVATEGRIWVRHAGHPCDVTRAEPRRLLAIRRETVGHVSQFLRIIPRVATIDIVAEPLIEAGASSDEARDRAARLLKTLGIPRSLWPISPATFSGGEQQRVNVARTLIHLYPIILADEPTAALDAHHAKVVVDLLAAARDAGAAIIGIFHDQAVKDALATRRFDVSAYRQRALAAG